MQRYTTELSKKSRTFVPDMETKIETTNTGGKVLALDGEELVARLEFRRVLFRSTTNTGGKVLAFDGELVGRLEFSFDGNVMSIDHTYAFKKGMGVGGTLEIGRAHV